MDVLRTLGGMLQAGFSEEDMIAVGRVIGQATRRMAGAFVDSTTTVLAREEDKGIEGPVPALRAAPAGR